MQGLGGAGGIGAELAVLMEMFRYDQAATFILLVLILLFAVAQLSTRLRQRPMRQGH